MHICMCVHVCQTSIPETRCDNVLMCKLPPLVWEPNLWSFPLHTKCVPMATAWLTQWAQWVDCYNRPSVFHGESANMWSHRGTKEKPIHQITEYLLRTVVRHFCLACQDINTDFLIIFGLCHLSSTSLQTPVDST